MGATSRWHQSLTFDALQPPATGPGSGHHPGHHPAAASCPCRALPGAVGLVGALPDTLGGCEGLCQALPGTMGAVGGPAGHSEGHGA